MEIESELDASGDFGLFEAEVDNVRGAALEAIRRHTKSNQQNDIFRLIFIDAFDRRHACALAARLPLYVTFGIRGRFHALDISLASALSIFEAGIYTLDHIMDNELEGPLVSVSKSELLVAAIGMISHLPSQMCCGLDVDKDLAARLLSTFADGLASIGAGQMADVAAGNILSRPASIDISKVVELKTGARRSLFATLAATLADADKETVDKYSRFGVLLGNARQVLSDLQDLLSGESSRDLAAGVLTFPLALLLEKAEEPERSNILALLKSAKDDVSQRGVLPGYMRKYGVVREVVKVINQNGNQCKGLLKQLRPHPLAARALESLVDEVTPWR